MSTIEQRVIDIVVERLGVDREKVKIDSKFVDDLGADSLDLVELVLALEDEFDIDNIPDEVSEKMTTVRAAVEHLQQHIKA